MPAFHFFGWERGGTGGLNSISQLWFLGNIVDSFFFFLVFFLLIFFIYFLLNRDLEWTERL